MPVSLAIAVVVLAVAAGGVLAARQVARDRLQAHAGAARMLFRQTLAQESPRGRSSATTRVRLASAAAETNHALGVGVAVPGAGVAITGPTGASRTYAYPLGRNRRLLVTVSSAPIAHATRTAIEMGLGIGTGVLLLLVSFILALFDRRLASPLTALGNAIDGHMAGDQSARAEVKGPAELRRAANNLNAMFETLIEQSDRLRDAAAIDPLTGAINGQQFHESLGIELKRAQREGKPVGLVLIDLDGFGSINDAHGRPFGDETLKLVARRLRRVMRATDVLARLGADDFALILPGADTRLSLAIAERARNIVASGSTSSQQLVCSAGVACYPEDATDGSTLCSSPAARSTGPSAAATTPAVATTRRRSRCPPTRRSAPSSRACWSASGRSTPSSSPWCRSPRAACWATRRCRAFPILPAGRPTPGSRRPLALAWAPGSRR